jgi:hypothetical protein
MRGIGKQILIGAIAAALGALVYDQFLKERVT